ncbi:hypothetical protein M1B72_00240 [Geomonas paludis]|uniref:Uncharacterized protein n=1 Tax=Geomonas paludis TaxID=2740185 RepID=A0A6V8MQ97_9BACT|nr:hypothetical protein [Geomonas paludis]UPU36164.1 hypothetical protein M1B72_00240 [Geomonas paludis]GFO62226.1 hypothetical protein GMPD_01450 [Geomonas paludis]
MAEEKIEGDNGGSRHLKLVSEGDGDPAARRAQSWSPDQIVASCITSQQMENFRAYNNVCMTLPTNDMYAFSLPLEHAGELDQGEIPQAVRQQFDSHGSALSPTARITVQQSGRVWFIIDLDRKYSVRMVPTGLLVYSERL